jgi:transposase-like protein
MENLWSRIEEPYPQEFKAEALRRVRGDDAGVASVAASLNVDHALVRNRARRAEQAALAEGRAD